MRSRGYRFSAYWLRSSRNNCSLECNNSNWDIVPTLLLQFLRLGVWTKACFTHPAGCLGLALLPSAALSPFWGYCYSNSKGTPTAQLSLALISQHTVGDKGQQKPDREALRSFSLAGELVVFVGWRTLFCWLEKLF